MALHGEFQKGINQRLRIALVAVTLSAWPALLPAQSLSDAQVEANVLRALASSPELASQSITTKTVYGTVTLSGSVTDEAARLKAETLASTSVGVKKVIDELTLAPAAGDTPAATQADSHAGMVLQSDGSYAPANSSNNGSSPDSSSAAAPAYQRNDPDNDQQLDQQMESQQPDSGNGAGASARRPLYGQQDYPQNAPQQNGNAGNGQYPGQGYPQQSPQGGYAGQTYPQPLYGAPMDGGQTAGQNVVVPAGTLIRVRVNQLLASNRSQPGDVFDATVMHDVVAGGAIAIPRGASVQGRVLEAKPSGVLKGRGELTLQLTQVTLGGHVYPLVSDQWIHNGGDKTIQSVNRTAGFGALGALFGAVAGGGEGAAIGAGVGAAAGLGSSAASGRGQVVVPAEAVVTFHLAQPAAVQTVSEQELQRLAYGVPSRPRYARPRQYPGPYGYPPPPASYGYPY